MDYSLYGKIQDNGKRRYDGRKGEKIDNYTESARIVIIVIFNQKRAKSFNNPQQRDTDVIGCICMTFSNST